MKVRRAGAWLMVASAAAWAFGTIASKGVLDTSGAAPVGVLTVQLTASVLVLATVALLARQPIRPAWRDGWTGVLEPGLSYLLGLAGLARTSASTATVLGSLEPVVVPVLVWLLWRQAPGRRRLVLTAFATAGAIGVSWVGDGDGRSLTGDALVLGGVLTAALYAVVSARSVERHGVAALAMCQQATALVVVSLVAIGHVVMGGALWPRPVPWHVVAAAGSGVLNYALPFGLYLMALRRLALTSAAGYLSLIPVFGVAGSVVLLGERVSAMQIGGAVVVVAALAWLSRLDRDAEPEAGSPVADGAPSTMPARSAA